MLRNEDVYVNFRHTLIKLGLWRGKAYKNTFMRMMEFSFCDKWGK